MNAYSPGDVLDSKYEVVKPLATGGMGSVYLVRHRLLEEMRVVKILRQDVAADPANRKRFLREARLATQVKHPNVAILYDYSQLPEGPFFMVWEHVEGQEIGQRLHDDGPFPLPEALDLGIQALRGLAAIHDTGVIHRDVSPDNLMIAHDQSGRQRLKIIDLGLAKTLNPEPDFEITQTGTFMGKLRYCSPEQAEPDRSGPLDHRSDIYSLGLVLYEMIAGRSAFADADGPVFVFQRLKQDPLPLTGRNPAVDVPEEVSRAVVRSLARDREKRYPHAVAFIEALDEAARRLSAIATQRIEIEGRAAEAETAPQRVPPPRASERPTSVELSSTERQALLERIDRAAHRVRETTQISQRVDVALDAGQIEEAERWIEELASSNPNARELPRLRRRLEEVRQQEEPENRVAEVEKMLKVYLQEDRLELARLAFASLLELSPTHPKRSDYESWIGMLADEVDQRGELEEEIAAGREALAAGDFRTATRKLEALRKLDPDGELTDAFAEEIEEVRSSRDRDSGLEEHRHRFERALERGEIEQAEVELKSIESLGSTRVALDLLRGRLADARRRYQESLREDAFESRFVRHLDAGEFQAAREIAVELENVLPDSRRPAEMFGRIAEAEEEHRRRKAVDQGERQVETLLARGERDQAALALKVLLHLDPQNRNRRSYQRRLKSLES